MGSATVSVVQPSPDGPAFEQGAGLNDNSLVVRVQAGPTCWLLAGDIERRAEARLVSEGRLSPCELLKVPHHGSRTSSTPELLDALQPLAAVAGARPWGPLPFPHAEVAARYAERGVPLWRTSDGMVEVELAPEGLALRQGARSWLWWRQASQGAPWTGL